MIDGARFFLGGEGELVAQIWPNGAKLGSKLGFCHFLKFGLLVFLEIAYNDSSQ